MAFNATVEIGHAIATFSELGIGIASLLIVDIARWRAKVNCIVADPIAYNDLRVQARKMNFLYQLVIIVPHFLGEFGDRLAVILPYLSLLFGGYALFGMSFDLLGGHTCYFWSAFGSFVLSLICAAIEKAEAKVVDKSNAATEISIP